MVLDQNIINTLLLNKIISVNGVTGRVSSIETSLPAGVTNYPYYNWTKRYHLVFDPETLESDNRVTFYVEGEHTEITEKYVTDISDFITQTILMVDSPVSLYQIRLIMNYTTTLYKNTLPLEQYIYDNTSERDSYFASNPGELINGLRIKVERLFQEYNSDTEKWDDKDVEYEFMPDTSVYTLKCNDLKILNIHMELPQFDTVLVDQEVESYPVISGSCDGSKNYELSLSYTLNSTTGSRNYYHMYSGRSFPGGSYSYQASAESSDSTLIDNWYKLETILTGVSYIDSDGATIENDSVLINGTCYIHSYPWIDYTDSVLRVDSTSTITITDNATNRAKFTPGTFLEFNAGGSSIYSGRVASYMPDNNELVPLATITLTSDSQPFGPTCTLLKSAVDLTTHTIWIPLYGYDLPVRLNSTQYIFNNGEYLQFRLVRFKVDGESMWRYGMVKTATWTPPPLTMTIIGDTLGTTVIDRMEYIHDRELQTNSIITIIGD